MYTSEHRGSLSVHYSQELLKSYWPIKLEINYYVHDLSKESN